MRICYNCKYYNIFIHSINDISLLSPDVLPTVNFEVLSLQEALPFFADGATDYLLHLILRPSFFKLLHSNFEHSMLYRSFMSFAPELTTAYLVLTRSASLHKIAIDHYNL